ncbi:MAG: hypothetical protein QOE28_1635 [Solirubrobacteraceae bacterium]|nr:hypothetical protein [Solirubrobacteraceae bacterium]
MKHVFVTGAAGFIGSQLAERCLDRGWRVTAVDSLAPYYDERIKRENVRALEADPNCELIEADVLDLDLPAVLSDVDVVFHLAAQAGVRASWGTSFDVYTHSNITVTQRLLEAAKHADVARFVFASSSSVYGDAEQLPTAEDTMLLPLSPYGATKALTEYLAYLYFKSYGVPTVGLRYFSVYGPRQRPDMAFHRLILSALTGGEFSLFGDGEQTRDFTFVQDAVAGTVAAAERGEPGMVYNLGGGSQVSMNDVTGTVTEILGERPKIRHTEAQRGDARDTSADTSRARSALGFTPTTTLLEGLARQVEWQRENLELLASAADPRAAGAAGSR